LKPTVKLQVDEIVKRKDDKSKAQVFIGPEAAKLLGLNLGEWKGIYRMRIKRLNQVSQPESVRTSNDTVIF